MGDEWVYLFFAHPPDALHRRGAGFGVRNVEGKRHRLPAAYSGDVDFQANSPLLPRSQLCLEHPPNEGRRREPGRRDMELVVDDVDGIVDNIVDVNVHAAIIIIIIAGPHDSVGLGAIIII